jgi:hypothetical protein
MFRFFSSLDHVQTILSQRMNNALANKQAVATYDATRLWAGSKNKLLAHIASRSLKNRALQESPVMNTIAKVDTTTSADAVGRQPRPAASAAVALKAELSDVRVKSATAMAPAVVTHQAVSSAAPDVTSAVPCRNERELPVPATSNASRALPVLSFRRNRMTQFCRGGLRFYFCYGNSLPEYRPQVTQQRSRKNGGEV